MLYTRRRFLVAGVAAAAGVISAKADNCFVQPASVSRSWTFNGWFAYIDPAPHGYVFGMCRERQGYLWGVTPGGQRCVADIKTVLSNSLDVWAAIKPADWTPAHVCHTICWSVAAGYLVDWWASKLDDTALKAFPGVEPVWKKDPLGWWIFATAAAKGRNVRRC